MFNIIIALTYNHSTPPKFIQLRSLKNSFVLKNPMSLYELKEQKYLWTRESTITSDMLNKFIEMENNEKVISPADAKAGQDWYLWAYAEDIYGNIVLEKSSEFYIDTTSPTVEFTPNGNKVWTKSQTVEVTFEDLEEELKRLGASELTASNYGGYVTNYSPKNGVNVG